MYFYIYVLKFGICLNTHLFLHLHILCELLLALPNLNAMKNTVKQINNFTKIKLLKAVKT